MNLLINDNYFKQFPDHVLGQAYTGTGRFGGEEMRIKKTGTIEDIAAKIYPEYKDIKPQPWHLELRFDAPTKKSLIAEAIKKTQEQEQFAPDNTGFDIIPFDELQQKWGSAISEDEKKIWVWYNLGKIYKFEIVANKKNGWSKYITTPAERETLIPKWIESGLLAYDGNAYIPAPIYYSGNIYQKQAKMQENKLRIEARIGKQAFEQQRKHLVNSAPEFLKLDAPASERLYISPIDPFADNVFITSLTDNTVFDDQRTLVSAFRTWVTRLDATEFKNGSSSYEILNYFLDRERFPNDTSIDEKTLIKRRSQLDALALFSKFLHEMVTLDDQKLIEFRWNSEYNNWAEMDYSKVPVGFEINRWFNNAFVDPRPALWDGVKFIQSSGSGCIAFDVGVGKTMTAILCVAQALYTGQCKRPLIIVPNATYENWKKECVGKWNKDGTVSFNGILPMYKNRINDYYNLGVETIKDIHKIWPKDYSISFMSYEGLEQLGFSEAARSVLRDKLFDILNQGGLKQRDFEKLQEDIDKVLGNITAGTDVNFDELGFDYIVVDEAHNFKKIFTRVKGREGEEGERQSSPYQISAGEPSMRGLKLFAIAQWVQQNNDLRNVVLLTATPFTNSPLEIYSILSLMAYKHLENRGIVNLIDFFDKFINEENEMAVSLRGRIESKPVIKTYNNRQVLQNIIFSSIIYRTGAEVGVPRPHKVVVPYLKDENGIFLPPDEQINSFLRPTPDQQYWLREIARFADNEGNQSPNAIEAYVPADYYDERKLPGRVLIALSLAKSCTLSPYLMRIGGKNGINVFDDTPPNYKEFIESSPKLQYVLGCIATVKKWHEGRNEPVSGQVIYMNMAVDEFPKIKEYLVKEIGYKDEEVQIIASGISLTKKERIKDDFLSGKVKIIIGSATIKEGINLQTRSTVLYNCALDWNPTDVTQLEGRIWRQGNIHSFVRIVNPLIENSLDVFIFQKLEEKTSRINDIWYRKGRGNVLSLEEFDPEELKRGLMTDPDEIVRAVIKQEKQRLTQKITVATDNEKKLKEATETIKKVAKEADALFNQLPDSRKYLQGILQNYRTEMADTETSKTAKEALESKERTLAELLNRPENDKVVIGILKRAAREKIKLSGQNTWEYGNRQYVNMISKCDDHLKNINTLEGIEKNILQPKGLTLMDDLSQLITEYEFEKKALEEESKALTSQETFDARIQVARDEMAEAKALSKPLHERITEFERYNYLLSCLKDIHECSLTSRQIITKVKQLTPNPDDKRIRIAKAKAKALMLKLKLKQAA